MIVNREMLIKYMKESNNYDRDDIYDFSSNGVFISVQKSNQINDVVFYLYWEYNKWVIDYRNRKIDEVIL